MGSENGLRMDNCTKQSLRMAPNSKVEDTVEASEPRALECEGSILADEDFTEPFIQVGCDSIEKGREHSKDWPNG